MNYTVNTNRLGEGQSLNCLFPPRKTFSTNIIEYVKILLYTYVLFRTFWLNYVNDRHILVDTCYNNKLYYHMHRYKKSTNFLLTKPRCIVFCHGQLFILFGVVLQASNKNRRTYQLRAHANLNESAPSHRQAL